MNNLFQSSDLRSVFKLFSVKRKERRFFFGKRPQEKADDLSNGAATMDDNPCGSSAVSDIPIPDSTADCENVSRRKLLNTSFEKLESSRGILTRQQPKEVGLGSASGVEMATGFKIQDAVLLSEYISTAAI